MGVVPKHRKHRMRSWKAVLGAGAACAACCAVPLFGGAAALTAGATAVAAAGTALLACIDEFLPLALVLLALAAVGGGLNWWRRRAARPTHQAVGCTGGCSANPS